jgi:hypothetical protein
LEYELFEQKKKIRRAMSDSKLSKNKCDRFATMYSNKVGSGPGLYNVLNEWAPKDKNKKGLLSLISKVPSPNIYYK